MTGKLYYTRFTDCRCDRYSFLSFWDLTLTDKAPLELPSDACSPSMFLFCFVLFCFVLTSLSTIVQVILVVTGSWMLTFIVLPHWNIMPQTLDMIPHQVILSWHWVDQSKPYPVILSAKQGAASTIFNDYGMPGTEPMTSYFPEWTL